MNVRSQRTSGSYGAQSTNLPALRHGRLPAGVSDIRLSVRVPVSLPAGRRPALHAVVKHCTVHNTLASAPQITIELD